MITCGFVGLGLIGGSIARALKANRKDIVIIACDPNEETLKLATEQKIADEAYAVENAVSELKVVATGIIESNENDGVAKYLHKIPISKPTIL